ncbi:MAG: hypothetical protein ABIZ70_13410 [Gemmatimonadales bacterium]
MTVRRQHLRRAATCFGLLTIWHLAAPAPAAAYVDPMSGSIVVQVVVAAILGATVGIRRSWQAILGFFRRLTRRKLL